MSIWNLREIYVNLFGIEAGNSRISPLSSLHNRFGMRRSEGAMEPMQ